MSSTRLACLAIALLPFTTGRAAAQDFDEEKLAAWRASLAVSSSWTVRATDEHGALYGAHARGRTAVGPLEVLLEFEAKQYQSERVTLVVIVRGDWVLADGSGALPDGASGSTLTLAAGRAATAPRITIRHVRSATADVVEVDGRATSRCLLVDFTSETPKVRELDAHLTMPSDHGRTGLALAAAQVLEDIWRQCTDARNALRHYLAR